MESGIEPLKKYMIVICIKGYFQNTAFDKLNIINLPDDLGMRIIRTTLSVCGPDWKNEARR